MERLSPAYASRFSVLVALLVGLTGLPLCGCGNGTGASNDSTPIGANTKEEAPAAKPELVAKLREMGAGVELDRQGRIQLITHREGGFDNDDLRLFRDLEQIETLRILDGEIQMSGGSPPPKVNDEGVAHLRGLTTLKKLSLSDTGVTDDGLAHVSQLVNLEQLVLAGTGVSDAGLDHLTNLRKLRYLDLSGTRITDEGLPKLEALPNLETLDIHSTVVTDEGLAHLKKMSTLTLLDLADCPGVTESAIEDVRQALPNCDVVR